MEEKIYERQLTLLETIWKRLVYSQDIDYILHIYLTGLTAGIFLGFSRAFILFFDKEKNLFYGKKGIGPFDQNEAEKIWKQLEKTDIPVERFFENGKRDEIKNSKFNKEVENIEIYLEQISEDDYLKRIVNENKIFIIYNVENEKNLPSQIKKLLYPSDLLVGPLFSERGLIGVIFADNAFHRNPINEEIINFFTLITFQVSISIENVLKFNEIKKIHQKLIQMERLSAIGKFSLFIAHEIKNPILTIGGFSKQITETDDVEKIKRNASIVYKEMIRLEKVLNNILSFSNLPKPVYEDVYVCEIVKEIVEIFENEIKKKNLEINLLLQENIKIKADPIQLREVIFNIFNNAIENTDYGKIEVKCEIDGDYLKIIISDTGKGIPEEELPYITKPFYSKKPQGIGLGLNIAKEIIENHNGKIEIKSQLNKGTEVFIYLPLEVKNEKNSYN